MYPTNAYKTLSLLNWHHLPCKILLIAYEKEKKKRKLIHPIYRGSLTMLKYTLKNNRDKWRLMSPCSGRRVRWCPTTEQITVLKELYRRGLTNPNAFQIRTITLQLSIYGDVHGKNVFYWFQNRKARDRQMIRRKLHQQHPLQLHLFQHVNSFNSESSQKNIPQVDIILSS